MSKGISLNGIKLHEVRMKLAPYSKGTVSYLLYPKDRMKFDFIENSMNLEIPSLLIIELFRRVGHALFFISTPEDLFAKISLPSIIPFPLL